MLAAVDIVGVFTGNKAGEPTFVGLASKLKCRPCIDSIDEDAVQRMSVNLVNLAGNVAVSHHDG